MSVFSDAFAGAFISSAALFGETCRIGGVDYPCILNAMVVGDDVSSGNPGRRQTGGGTLVLQSSVWTQVHGRKGLTITVDGVPFRVQNDPDFGVSDTVTLQLGPQT